MIRKHLAPKGRAGLPVACALALTLVISGCGGGSGEADPPLVSESEATTVVGPITGFGSVIVNGIHFDDSNAEVTDDGGDAIPGGRGALRLGMMVEVRGSVGAGASSGVAARIAVRGELEGPIDSIDVAAGTFGMFGVTVHTTEDTLYENVAGLAALQAGDIVEVHGFRDPLSGALNATRIERRPAGAAIRVQVRGMVEDLLVGRQAFVLTLGERSFFVDYSSAVVRPSTQALADGVWVKVVSSELPEAGVIRADRVQVRGPREHEDHSLVEVTGFAANVTDGGLRFEVDAVPVDATGASFVRGLPVDVAPGRLLEVKGRWDNGVLVARMVKFEDVGGGGSDNGPQGNPMRHEFEIEGTVGEFLSVAEFFVRGTRIDASAAQFERGTPQMLARGARVEIEGVPGSGGIAATRVKFED